MLTEDRSLQTFRIQVDRGLFGGLLQLSGGCWNRIQLSSAISFIWATCPDRENWWELTTQHSGWCCRFRLAPSFMTKLCHRISKILWRHHWSNASICCTSSLLTIQHCDPYSIIGGSAKQKRRSMLVTLFITYLPTHVHFNGHFPVEPRFASSTLVLLVLEENLFLSSVGL